jgi:hypothetical protein
MALEKTSGRSKAPGGMRFLLGLPWGVCMGEMKAGSSREGVPRMLASSMLCEERVCVSGGGTGKAKSCLWALVKGDPEAIARAVVLMWRVSARGLPAGIVRGDVWCLQQEQSRADGRSRGNQQQSTLQDQQARVVVV